MSKVKKWFSFAENEDFNGSEPSFFDVSNKDWKILLEKNYLLILADLQNVISSHNKNIVPYFNQTLASVPTAWTVFPLIFWGAPYPENCSDVKETMNVINK